MVAGFLVRKDDIRDSRSVQTAAPAYLDVLEGRTEPDSAHVLRLPAT